MSYFKQTRDIFPLLMLCLLLMIINGCGGYSGLLKTKKKASLRLNQVYASNELSIVGSINQKGPLFFHLELPSKIRQEWMNFQKSMLLNPLKSQEVNFDQPKWCSSWVQGRLTKQWIKLNPKTSRSLNLSSYRDLTGASLVTLSEISFGSLKTRNLNIPLLNQDIKRKQNQSYQDALLDLEGLIAFIGGDQARGHLCFDKGTLEIEQYSAKKSQNIPPHKTTPHKTTPHDVDAQTTRPQNAQTNHQNSVQLKHKLMGIHLDRFAPLWTGRLAFPKKRKSDPYPIVGSVTLRENATLQTARKELGVSPLSTSPSSLESYDSPETDFVFLWTFPHQELPQDLWLLVQISPKSPPSTPQSPSSESPSSESSSSKSTIANQGTPLYFRVYLNSKYRQDRIKSTLIESKWRSSKPLILPPQTPIYLLDVHRGPWTCFHPVCLEEIGFHSP